MHIFKLPSADNVKNRDNLVVVVVVVVFCGSLWHVGP